jgi:hypothetical protein
MIEAIGWLILTAIIIVVSKWGGKKLFGKDDSEGMGKDGYE